MRRPMSRRIICILCVMAFAVLYTFTRTDAALMLLLAAILLPIASLVLGAISARGTSVFLSIPAEIYKGSQTHCALTVDNRSFVPSSRVELTLFIKNTLTGCEGRFGPITASVPFLGKTELAFVFETSHCGQFVFTADSFHVYDFLGLRGIRKTFPLKKKCIVPPEIFPLRVKLSGGTTLEGREMFSVPRKGQDRTEPFQIRDYAEGDSPKQIHWKLTQKFGRYIVTDPSQELEQALLIVWDSGQLETDTPEVTDTLAEALISLCVELNEEGVSYEVIWKNGEMGDVILKDVSEKEDVFDVVSGVLCADGADGKSLIPEFLSLLNGRRYPLVAYFSGGFPKELAQLESVGRITAFLCGTGNEPEEYRSFIFSPDNYASVLRDITI